MGVQGEMIAAPETYPRPTRLRLARVAWVAVSGLAVVLFFLGIPHYYNELAAVCSRGATVCAENGLLTPELARQLAGSGLSTGVYAAYNVALDLVFAAVWCGTGLVVFLRRSDDAMALLASLALVTFGSFQASQETVAETYPPLRGAATFVALVGFASIILFVYLFPDGRFVPRWMLFPALVWVLNDAVSVLTPEAFEFGWFGVVGFLAFFVPAALAVGSQVYRYRKTSDTAQRQQTKWVVFGIVTALGGYLALVAVQGIFADPEEGALLAFVFFESAPNFLFLAIPISVGLAVLRSGLWDIDEIINRALVYGALTTSLALVYFGSVVALQYVLRALTGHGSTLAVVASTLAIAALFNPLRRRAQRSVDRLFYRRKYDARATLAAFARGLRDETDLPTLEEDLVRTVRITVQPEHASLWLRARGPAGPEDGA
jgi:hypothetical protein